MTDKKPSRKEQILQSLAHMLEAAPGGRITTAGLAKEVGVSEAALYRHFPSKAKMFEGLISFIEEAIFSRINRIMEDGKASDQVEQILTLLLAFTERNPGITRLLTGDALTGENARLHQRIQQFYDRVESQVKQVLRDAEFKEGLRTQATRPSPPTCCWPWPKGALRNLCAPVSKPCPARTGQLNGRCCSPPCFV